MSTLDLSGCVAKLDRAEHQLDTLGSEIRQFAERDGQAHILRSQFDPANDSFTVFYEEAQPIPQFDWGIRLGEVVHNARSALDHLVALLVLDANGQIGRHHQFPICNGPKEWKRRVSDPPPNRKSALEFVDAAPTAVIEEVQPYQATTGLPSLATLRDFSNTDKHRIIHAARMQNTAEPALMAWQMVPLTLTDVTRLNPGSAFEDGTELARFKAHFDLPGDPAWQLPSNSEMNVRLDLQTTAVFGEPGQERTRLQAFRSCLADCRVLLARF